MLSFAFAFFAVHRFMTVTEQRSGYVFFHWQYQSRLQLEGYTCRWQTDCRLVSSGEVVGTRGPAPSHFFLKADTFLHIEYRKLNFKRTAHTFFRSEFVIIKGKYKEYMYTIITKVLSHPPPPPD